MVLGRSQSDPRPRVSCCSNDVVREINMRHNGGTFPLLVTEKLTADKKVLALNNPNKTVSLRKVVLVMLNQCLHRTISKRKGHKHSTSKAISNQYSPFLLLQQYHPCLDMGTVHPRHSLHD